MKETAIGVVLEKDRKHILLIKRRDVPVWVLPGGGIEEDESPEQAVCREILEETGMHATIIHKVATYHSAIRLSNTVHVFLLQSLEGSPTLNEEAAAVGFHPLNDLPKPFFILHEPWLQDALSSNGSDVHKTLRLGYLQAIWYGLRNPKLAWYYFLSKCLGSQALGR